jgi:nitrite reductase/ring-hydroxylating ferredoxin subunit
VIADSPFAPSLDEEDEVLICPWHGWEFSLRDGTAFVDPNVNLRAFPTEVRDGRIMAQLR